MNKTSLHAMHCRAGARMVPFAGYEMPVQYPEGIRAEHLHTREKAGLFDVSHMGQVLVSGEHAALELERLLPVDLQGMAVGEQCYTFFTLPDGGILDDLIIARRAQQQFFLVVNASRKLEDLAYLQQQLHDSRCELLEGVSLLALQGPLAAASLVAALPEVQGVVAQLEFMQTAPAAVTLHDTEVILMLCRSGYTGEDGFEIALVDEHAQALADRLLAQDDVAWAGLGARDSLRLEAGLCLYGHDIDEQTTPVEAGLSWSIDKVRRGGGERTGGFPGAEKIFSQLDGNVSRRRRGFLVEGRAPVREGAQLQNSDGDVIGQVTSGGFSPSLARPICMGYVETDRVNDDTQIYAEVRGKKIALAPTKLPFVKRR